MPKRKKAPPAVPTDEEILAYDNVPIAVAARYIGMSENSLRLALREERARYLGFAVMGMGHLVYNISPGGLVRYKRNGGEIIPFEHLQDVLVKTIVDEVERRMPFDQ